jgi:dihydrofolate reductase
MKSPKDEKIQVLLSSVDHQKLKNIIISDSTKTGKLMTVSAYVRELILMHIRVYEGEQKSFANETIKKLIEDQNKNQ